MRTTKPASALQHQPVAVRVQLAAAWASFMFLYVYVDILSLYRPGVIEDILAGVVWKLEITQTWAVGALALMAIPILMVALSTTMPARANRVANLAVASIYALVSIANAVGEPWTYYFALAVALELAVLGLILRTAWTWPRHGQAPRAPRSTNRAATWLDGDPSPRNSAGRHVPPRHARRGG